MGGFNFPGLTPVRNIAACEQKDEVENLFILDLIVEFHDDDRR